MRTMKGKEANAIFEPVGVGRRNKE